MTNKGPYLRNQKEYYEGEDNVSTPSSTTTSTTYKPSAPILQPPRTETHNLQAQDFAPGMWNENQTMIMFQTALYQRAGVVHPPVFVS